MKLKIYMSLLCLVSCVCIASTGAVLASNKDNVIDVNETNNSENKGKDKKSERPKLTDEQKAEIKAKKEKFKAKREDMNNKWNALTDDQKEEVYSLKDKALSINNQIIDKYLEWGIVNEETANKMKEILSNCSSEMREDNKMPIIEGMKSKHKHEKIKSKNEKSTQEITS